jgi:hypothetical protein
LESLTGIVVSLPLLTNEYLHSQPPLCLKSHHVAVVFLTQTILLFFSLFIPSASTPAPTILKLVSFSFSSSFPTPSFSLYLLLFSLFLSVSTHKPICTVHGMSSGTASHTQLWIFNLRQCTDSLRYVRTVINAFIK